MKPLFGDRVYNNTVANIVDTLCTIGIVLAMACGLGNGLSFVLSGFKVVYGIDTSIIIWIVMGLAVTALFTCAAYLGIDKGIKRLATFNSKIFYFAYHFICNRSYC